MLSQVEEPLYRSKNDLKKIFAMNVGRLFEHSRSCSRRLEVPRPPPQPARAPRQIVQKSAPRCSVGLPLCRCCSRRAPRACPLCSRARRTLPRRCSHAHVPVRGARQAPRKMINEKGSRSGRSCACSVVAGLSLVSPARFAARHSCRLRGPSLVSRGSFARFAARSARCRSCCTLTGCMHAYV